MSTKRRHIKISSVRCGCRIHFCCPECERRYFVPLVAEQIKNDSYLQKKKS